MPRPGSGNWKAEGEEAGEGKEEEKEEEEEEEESGAEEEEDLAGRSGRCDRQAKRRSVYTHPAQPAV